MHSTKVGEGSKYDGKAADIFSTGACLFTMLAGFPPFGADDVKVREKYTSKAGGRRW